MTTPRFLRIYAGVGGEDDGVQGRNCDASSAYIRGTDAGGRRAERGVPAGEYFVQFAPAAVPASMRAEDAAQKVEVVLEAIRTESGPPKEYGPIPSKYASAVTSNLRIMVEPGMNTADFRLSRNGE